LQVFWHTPALHETIDVFVPWQTTAHLPQLETSVFVSTHEPLQSVSSGEQLLTHWLLEQTSPLPQMWPHDEQLSWSLVRSTQTPLQSV
jgi:hypothetical protein